mgnify:CR=1 FL=1
MIFKITEFMFYKFCIYDEFKSYAYEISRILTKNKDNFIDIISF